MAIMVGTADGIQALDSDHPAVLAGHRIDALVRGAECWWVLSDGETVWNIPDGSTPSRISGTEDTRLNCLLPRSDDVLLGAEEANLLHIPVSGEQGVEPEVDEVFQRAPGRDDWYTPWGGPPDVRSLAEDVDGTVYLNVHVGGILRFRNDDPVWRDTMDIDADVHEVIAHPDEAGTALAATARGLAITRDGSATWNFHTEGFHARYCRAVAVSGDRVYVSASRSNRGEKAAVYRTTLDGVPLERCNGALPEWFSTNVNTACLQASGDTVLIGDANGTVYQSEDAATTWFTAAKDLPAIRCLGIA